MANGKLLSGPEKSRQYFETMGRLDGCQVYSALNLESTFLHEDRKVKSCFCLAKVH